MRGLVFFSISVLAIAGISLSVIGLFELHEGQHWYDVVQQFRVMSGWTWGRPTNTGSFSHLRRDQLLKNSTLKLNGTVRQEETYAILRNHLTPFCLEFDEKTNGSFEVLVTSVGGMQTDYEYLNPSFTYGVGCFNLLGTIPEEVKRARFLAFRNKQKLIDEEVDVADVKCDYSLPSKDIKPADTSFHIKANSVMCINEVYFIRADVDVDEGVIIVLSAGAQFNFKNISLNLVGAANNPILFTQPSNDEFLPLSPVLQGVDTNILFHNVWVSLESQAHTPFLRLNKSGLAWIYGGSVISGSVIDCTESKIQFQHFGLFTRVSDSIHSLDIRESSLWLERSTVQASNMVKNDNIRNEDKSLIRIRGLLLGLMEIYLMESVFSVRGRTLLTLESVPQAHMACNHIFSHGEKAHVKLAKSSALFYKNTVLAAEGVAEQVFFGNSSGWNKISSGGNFQPMGDTFLGADNSNDDCQSLVKLSFASYWGNCTRLTSKNRLQGKGGHHLTYEIRYEGRPALLRIIHNWNVGARPYSKEDFDSFKWKLKRIKDMSIRHSRFSKIYSYCMRDRREHATIIEKVSGGRNFNGIVPVRFAKLKMSVLFKINIDIALGISYFHYGHPLGNFHFQDFAPSPLGDRHFVNNVMIDMSRSISKFIDYDGQMLRRISPSYRLRDDVYSLGFMMAETMGSTGRKPPLFRGEYPRRLIKLCSLVPKYCELIQKCINIKEYPNLNSLEVVSTLLEIVSNKYDNVV